MKPISLFLITFMFGIVTLAQIPLRNYINLSHTVLNDPQKVGWGLPITNTPNFRDEFDDFFVDSLFRDPITNIPDTSYFLINGKWLWSWDTYFITPYDPTYYRFGNVYFSDTNHVSGTPASNKYLRLYDKREDLDLRTDLMYPVVKNYSSSMLLSADKNYYTTTLHHGQYFRYGYFEIRCNLPATRYSWPAFWLMGPNENPSLKNPAGWNEIDCFEHGSNDAIVHTNIWRDSLNNNKDFKSQRYTYALPGQTFGDTWVTYAIKWEPNKIIWYINNIPVKITRNIDKDNYNNSQVIIPSNKMYLVVNNGMNMDWVRYDMEQPAIYPNSMDIDYIRVYQRTDSANYVSNADPVFSINGISCGTDSLTPINLPSEKITLDASESYMPDHKYRITIKTINSDVLADVIITDGGTFNGLPVDISNFELTRIYNGFTYGSSYKITVRDTGNCNMPECVKTQVIRKIYGTPVFSLNGKQNIENSQVIIKFNNGKPSIVLDVSLARKKFNCTTIILGYFDGLVGDYTTGMHYYDIPITENYMDLSAFLKDNNIYADSSNGGFYTVGIKDYISPASPTIKFTIAPATPNFDIILNSLTSGLLKSHQKLINNSYLVTAGDDIILSKGMGSLGDTCTVYTVRVSGNGNTFISHTFNLLYYYPEPMNYEYNDYYNGENYSIGNFNIRSFCKANNYLLTPDVTYTVSLSVGDYTASTTFVIQPQSDYQSKFLIYSFGDWCASKFPNEHSEFLTDETLMLFSPDVSLSYPDSIISTSVDRSYTLKIEDLFQNKKDSFELTNSEIYYLKILGSLNLKNDRFNNIIKLDQNKEFLANTYRITLKNYTSSTPDNSLYRKESSQIITILPKDRIVSNGVLEIDFNKTITDAETYYLSSNLKVKSGKTLTIKGSLQFNKDCKLIVESGAKLIIDGGVLTNNKFYYPVTCHWRSNDTLRTWKGIEIWGNRFERQLQANQGYLKIKANGSRRGTIENAETAVLVANSISPAFSTGGILDIDSASFINNKNSIYMLYFHNYSATGLLINNVSKIRNSFFQADSSIHNLGNFISLYEVEGIEFSGNTFSYNNPGSIRETRGIGIECSNASCFINENSSGIGNKFIKLNYGIKVHNSNSLKSVTIRNNNFQSNLHGIDIRNSNNSILVSDTFLIANYINAQEKNTGVYMSYCSGYKFENNSFTSQDRRAIGAVIFDGFNTSNFIYKNGFYNLHIGTQLESSPLLEPSSQGTFVKCNTYYSNIKQADIAFTSGRVANPQGNCDNTDHKYSEGNIFSINGHTSTFKNLWSNYPNYFCTPFVYNTQNDIRPLSWSTGITPNLCSYTYNPSDCPSTLGVPGTSSNTLIARISSLNTQLTTLNSKIDGGNTQNLLNNVNSNISSGQLKNKLLVPGVYLSDTVLIATIKKTNPLPPGILKDIIVPNSPVTSKVMESINSIILPAGIKQNIISAQTGISGRSVVEQQISAIQQQKDIDIAELMRKYSNDTIIKIDSIILFLKSQPDINSKKQLAQAYLINQDCANATATLNELPQQTQEEILFKQFYSIMVSLCSQGKTVFDLTTSQKQIIYNIASSNTSVSVSAQSVLTTAYKAYYPEIIDDIIVPDSLTIRGYLFNNASCNNNSIANDTIVILDSAKQVVKLSAPVITDQQGFFKFNYNHIMLLDENEKYTFGTKSGAVIQDTIFKTIQQWVTASPVNLNLKKLNADFVNDTVACFDDTVHFTNNTMYGKKPYTYNWTFAFHAGSTQENPIYKYNSAGIYNTSLIATDVLGCKDTAFNQLIIPACPSIFGTLYENEDCGGSPVSGDTLVIKDNSGNIISTVTPAITNSNGEFNFSSNEIQLLDTTALYSLATKSGFEFENITVKTISQWKAESPLNLNLMNVNLEWYDKYIGIDSLQAMNQAIDLHGNVYVLGTYTLQNNGYDILLLKYNAIGQLIWDKKFNLQNLRYNYPAAFFVDSVSNIYISGTSSNGDSQSAIYTFKCDSNGIIQWDVIYNGPSNNSSARSLVVDESGNVYVGGYNFISGSGQSYYKQLVLKYNPSGIFEWEQNYSSPDLAFTQLSKIAIDSKGDVITSGFTQNMQYQGFQYTTIKYNKFGIVQWLINETPFTTWSNWQTDMLIDNSDNIFVTGSCGTVKYNSNGVKQWVQPILMSHLVFDSDENVIAMDYTNGLIKYQNQSGNILLSSNMQLSNLITDKDNNVYAIIEGKPGFVNKYDNYLNLVWSQPLSRISRYGRGVDVKISPNNNIYVAGYGTLSNTDNRGVAITIKYSQCYYSASALRYYGDNTQIPDLTSNSESEELESLSFIVNHQSSVEYVTMFPNPNDGNFYFNYSLPEKEKCQFAVFDPTGKKVYSIEIKGGKNTVMINHNNFSNGVYYYQITAGNRLIKTERLVITK